VTDSHFKIDIEAKPPAGKVTVTFLEIATFSPENCIIK
jgi:hypothetical protein